LEQFNNTVVLGGLDLSRTGDLTAFTTFLFDKKNKKIVAETMYWATQKYVDNVVKVPMKLWVAMGYVRVSGNELIDYHDILDYIVENHTKRGWWYMFINYDSYSAQYLIKELASIGYAEDIVLKATPQGAKTLSVPMQEMEGNLREKILCYQNNPVTAWCLSNAELEKDRNGNYLLRKGNYERKVDGVSTMLNCYVSLIPNKEYFFAED
jgi:phage terminase large subunit-like protein